MGVSVPLTKAGALLAEVARTSGAMSGIVGTRRTMATVGYDHRLSKRTDVYAMYALGENIKKPVPLSKECRAIAPLFSPAGRTTRNCLLIKERARFNHQGAEGERLRRVHQGPAAAQRVVDCHDVYQLFLSLFGNNSFGHLILLLQLTCLKISIHLKHSECRFT
jgi:hypothetical protein